MLEIPAFFTMVNIPSGKTKRRLIQPILKERNLILMRIGDSDEHSRCVHERIDLEQHTQSSRKNHLPLACGRKQG
jgi:hypothetical protein